MAKKTAVKAWAIYCNDGSIGNYSNFYCHGKLLIKEIFDTRKQAREYSCGAWGVVTRVTIQPVGRKGKHG